MVTKAVKKQRYNADLKEFRSTTGKPNFTPDTGAFIKTGINKDYAKFQKSQKKLRESRADRVKAMAKTFKRPTYS